jgi:hypothetical protein
MNEIEGKVPFLSGAKNIPYQNIADRLDISTSNISGGQEIKNAEKIELESLNDLVTMVTDWNGQNVTSLYYKEKDGVHYYFTWIIIHDYYNYRGIPLLLFATSTETPKNYIIHDTKTASYKFDDIPQYDPRCFVIKIIRIKSVPSFLDV